MTNNEAFERYSSEKWVLEENLCFMLQDFWDKVREKSDVQLPNKMPINPVTFIKGFLKEDTLVDVKWAEKSKMENTSKSPETIIDVEFSAE